MSPPPPPPACRRRGAFTLASAWALALLVAAGAPLAAAPPAPDRPATDAAPRIGLVLGGGGARGAAHIGVLEVLERAGVPVACVAGTSMGALVAGAWAAGLTPAQMREQLAGADWVDMFLDNPDWSEIGLRAKRLSQRYLPGSETGITPQGTALQTGVLEGQKVKLFFNQLVRADLGEPAIEALPLPLSIVATDIGSGERVVLRSGSLTQAMRASMAVPGLLAPAVLGGRKLVDGGLVDNLPVREVRERCGAEIVIAVNVGSPLLPADQVTGLLSVTAQMVALLTEQNVSASIAALGPRDVLIRPELGDINAAAFQRHAEAADLGRAAAEQVLPQLQALALPPTAYAAWQRSVRPAQRERGPIDAIEIASMPRVPGEVAGRWLQQRPGEPIDTEALRRDLLRMYGDGHYEKVDYQVLEQRGRRVLRVLPVEKSWGPDYLRLGLTLESELRQGSSYQLRAAYQKTWINRRGGELLFGAELGSTSGVSAEWYQPLDLRQRSFFVLDAGLRRDRIDFWSRDRRVAQYLAQDTSALAGLGLNLGLLGQARLAWRERRQESELETGTPIAPRSGARSELDLGTRGWLLVLDLDRTDALHFPTRGWSLLAEVYADRSSGEGRRYERLTLDLRAAWPLADFVLATRAHFAASMRGTLPLADAPRLGGLLNLSGYSRGQLVGDEVNYLQLRGERILGRAPLGLRGDLRVGLGIEAGRIGEPYTRQRREGWLGSLVAYLGGETPFGPLFTGVGWAGAGGINLYLVLGTR